MPEQGRDEVSRRLEGLAAVTDTALTRLSVEDLLVELLARVQELLEADTATVLLLDEQTGDLVATAALGLEEEVREGVRVPLGQGFAGRVAATAQPVVLDRVDETTVTNPILWEHGVQKMAGVPLLAAGQVLGVLHVGRQTDRNFTEENVELLEVVAQRVAAATQTRQLAVERTAAALLERSLLPGRLPSCPGLEFATRYRTPEDRLVGGDWYDLFVLPSQELWVVTGDVAGHGLASAVIMGRIKSAVRAYTLLGEPPETVLEMADRKVNVFEMNTLATVVAATSSPPYRDFRIASAGHPLPVLAAPGEAARLIELPVGPPLGISGSPTRYSATVKIPDSAVMLFYTDGLIERRNEDLDAGIKRLLRHVHPEAPDEVCRRVLRGLLEGGNLEDDLSMVAVRRVSHDQT